MLNIIEILELQKEDFNLVMQRYQQALSLAKKIGDFKTEAAVLRSMISSFKEYGKEVLAGKHVDGVLILKNC